VNLKFILSVFVQCALLPRLPAALSILRLVVGLLALSGKAEGLVGHELATHAIGGSEDGGGEDDTEGDQLRRDLLEGAETLGDGVCCNRLLVRIMSLKEWYSFAHRIAPPSVSGLAYASVSASQGHIQELPVSLGWT
jgi:hypothetical protein